MNEIRMSIGNIKMLLNKQKKLKKKTNWNESGNETFNKPNFLKSQRKTIKKMNQKENRLSELWGQIEKLFSGWECYIHENRWKEHVRSLRHHTKATSMNYGWEVGKESHAEGIETISLMITAKKFQSLGKARFLPIQEAHRTQNRTTETTQSKKQNPPNIIQLKHKYSEQRECTETFKVTHKDRPTRVGTNFWADSLDSKGVGMKYFKFWRPQLPTQTRQSCTS